MSQKSEYYVPEPSHWPIVAAVGMFLTLGGFAFMLNDGSAIPMLVGLAVMAYMFFGWFGTVIDENESGKLDDDQVDRSFRQGMMWFIISEVAFFAAFFGALFYYRVLVIPWLGEGETAAQIWPNFQAVWPLLTTPDPSKYEPIKATISAWGIPFLNTAILLTSGATLTWAHWGLQKGNRKQLVNGLILTVALGFIFLGFQAYEYMHAYSPEINFKMTSGIYGSTFFMLTGFHGAHVTIGALMLLVILVRSAKGHFTERRHFGFEAAAWYWHFVDVVWLGLFIFVYVL
ncbi:cytochrome c oxidase subunit 3 [Magnetococcales bacterium HHB-1]